ncbi:stage III sporulation protein AD [Gehongia tenuis]|uniref:Stage III sporulation protein AD n=1 Tax=Gehongia tenuis TaxID=2763655 RepID=A0A926D462_9FIRM|nr:stage III sporulation protein AD [Gehongia tenuis]MBC8531157.1 stage III sporulation protein AD [Gehongia tenuis]
MQIVSIAGLGVVAAILSITLRKDKPEMAMLLGVGAGAILLIAFLSMVSPVMDFLKDLAARANLQSEHLALLFKVVGVAYIAEFASQVCKDAGEGAIASKIEMGGKLVILVLCLPIMGSLFELIVGMLP